MRSAAHRSAVPAVGRLYQLPPGPTTNRLQWLLTKLVPGAPITDQEITENFDASWLASNNIAQTRAFIESVRTSYPNAIVTDVITVTPVRVTVLIDSPGSPPPSGFLQFGALFGHAAHRAVRRQRLRWQRMYRLTRP